MRKYKRFEKPEKPYTIETVVYGGKEVQMKVYPPQVLPSVRERTKTRWRYRDKPYIKEWR